MPAREVGESLAERVARMRVGPRPAPAPVLDDAALAARLGARVVVPGLLAIEERFEPGAAHGAGVLDPGRIVEAATFYRQGRPPDGALVFMDTETTGLAGGTGTVAFLIGLLVAREGSLSLTQLLLTRFAGEPEMLRRTASLAGPDSVLVSYNGKTFDAPLIASRSRLGAVPDPFAALEHLDLLHDTRRAFGRVWPDCRLTTVERRLLGVRRMDDLPGAEAPEVWMDWIRYGRADRLPAVLRHNRLDLLSLAVLLGRLHRCHEDPIDSGADPVALFRARPGGLEEGALFDYLAERCDALDPAGGMELARLARRRRDWRLATGIWHRLAGAGHVEALERLAKYCEHQSRDLESALAHARRLLDLEPGSPRHAHREARLVRKLAR